LSMEIRERWPDWVEICTFVSHFLLATKASVNILLFCGSDKRFMVVVQRTLRYCVVCPATVKGTEGHVAHDSADINAPPPGAPLPLAQAASTVAEEDEDGEESSRKVSLSSSQGSDAYSFCLCCRKSGASETPANPDSARNWV